ncbi:hypothetical protein LC040_12315 [Bacillus tianshenii]|nr:hypothetical protein LC040_12315 [Bacillus tianshenii]
MNGVLTASRLMTAKEVKEECAKALSNPCLLIAVELEAKRQLLALNWKMGAQIKSSKCAHTHCSQVGK